MFEIWRAHAIDEKVFHASFCLQTSRSSMPPTVVKVEKTPQSDRIAVEAPGEVLEVAVCAFSKTISETVRLACRPDRPFQTIIQYDGDKERFLSQNVVAFRPPDRRFSLDILHERPLSEVHLRMVDMFGNVTVRRVHIDNYVSVRDKNDHATLDCLAQR